MEKNMFINLKKSDVINFLGFVPLIIIYGMLTRIYIDPKTSVDFVANTMSLAVMITLIYVYFALMYIMENSTSIANFISRLQKNKPKTKKNEILIDKKLVTKMIESKEKQEELRIKQKLKVALDYTTKEFAPYVSSIDLESLHKSITLYYEKGNLDDIKAIETNTLKTIDIYHFGWNIWNYFKVGQQGDLAIFLKKIFPKLLEQIKDVEVIKKNLKKEELSGFIKITKDLKTIHEETTD